MAAGALTCRQILRAVLVGGVLVAAPVKAAGGADVVDDAFVEQPGTCHVESWLVDASADGSLAHLGIGCTPKAVPRLELDGAVEHPIGHAGGWSFQPGIKYTLLAHPGALALGVSAGAQLDRQGHLSNASINLPISVTGGRYTQINLNLGWRWLGDRAGGENGVTWGAQVDQAIARHLRIVGEIFGTGLRDRAVQGGVRWSPGPQRIDLDLRAFHAIGSSSHALILGFTLRS